MARALVLPGAFYGRDALEVAPELLNKVLVGNDVAARIVEVEAYRADEDPGSHAYRGRTRRNASMFGAPGTLYVYFSYGNHWCMNAVCGPGERPHAVLLRAAAPVRGLDVMHERRPKAARDRDLCAGPGRLAQALAITRELNGNCIDMPPFSLTAASRRARIVRGPRIGISKAVDQPWRFGLAGSHYVSRPFPKEGW